MVRKDLTKLVGNAVVPTYVLVFTRQHCASSDDYIEEGILKVKAILKTTLFIEMRLKM